MCPVPNSGILWERRSQIGLVKFTGNTFRESSASLATGVFDCMRTLSPSNGSVGDFGLAAKGIESLIRLESLRTKSMGSVVRASRMCTCLTGTTYICLLGDANTRFHESKLLFRF